MWCVAGPQPFFLFTAFFDYLEATHKCFDFETGRLTLSLFAGCHATGQVQCDLGNFLFFKCYMCAHCMWVSVTSTGAVSRKLWPSDITMVECKMFPFSSKSESPWYCIGLQIKKININLEMLWWHLAAQLSHPLTSLENWFHFLWCPEEPQRLNSLWVKWHCPWKEPGISPCTKRFPHYLRDFQQHPGCM